MKNLKSFESFFNKKQKLSGNEDAFEKWGILHNQILTKEIAIDTIMQTIDYLMDDNSPSKKELEKWSDEDLIDAYVNSKK